MRRINFAALPIGTENTLENAIPGLQGGVLTGRFAHLAMQVWAGHEVIHKVDEIRIGGRDVAGDSRLHEKFWA
ncbi:MAG TPA: hypothetical protein VGL97_00785, partial [Bryobacteraceae bacterium]